MSRELAVFLDDLRAELSVYPIGSRISKRLHDRLMYLDDKYRGTVDPGRMPADACKDCGSPGAHYCTGKPRSQLNEQIRKQFQEGRREPEPRANGGFEQQYMGRWEGPEMFERVRRD